MVLDANFWKSFVHARLKVATGDKGSLSLYKRRMQTEHRLFAEHLRSSETPRVEKQNGRSITVWKHNSSKPDNHFFDCLSNAAALASACGAKLSETTFLRSNGDRCNRNRVDRSFSSTRGLRWDSAEDQKGARQTKNRSGRDSFALPCLRIIGAVGVLQREFNGVRRRRRIGKHYTGLHGAEQVAKLAERIELIRPTSTFCQNRKN